MCGEGWEVGLRSRSSESKWDGLVSCVEWGAICGVGGVGMEWVVVGGEWGVEYIVRCVGMGVCKWCGK